MNIGKKLMLGISSVALFMGMSAFISSNVISNKVKSIVEVDGKKNKAVLEMEININEAANNLLSFVRNPKLIDERANFEDNVKDYQNYRDIYVQNGLSINEENFLQELDTNFKKFTVISTNLKNVVKEQTSLIKKYTNILNTKIEKKIEEELQLNISSSNANKISSMLELEINTHKLVSATRGYLLSGDSLLLQKIEGSLSDFEKWMQNLKLLKLNTKERAVVLDIDKSFSEIKTITNTIVDLEQEKNSQVNQIKKLVADIDSILDDKVQTVVNDNIYAKEQEIFDNYKLNDFLTILAVGLSMLIAYLIARSITNPLARLKHAIEEFNKGKLDFEVKINTNDEVQHLANTLEELAASNKEIVSSAEEIGKGNFNASIKTRSEHDTLGNSLINMRDNLRDLESKSKKDAWLKSQVAEITSLSQGQPNVVSLVQTILEKFSRTLGAGCSAFYLVGNNTEKVATSEKYLELVGSYAYKKRKNVSNQIKFGEGLVGQCAIEKKTICITNAPNDYILISSGLGERKPASIVVAPVLFEGNIIAVVEFASFHNFTEVELELLESITTNLGVIINGIKSKEKTEKLLAESMKMSEELQTQQEELKAANEELEEQTHELTNAKEELNQQKEELQATNEELEEKTNYLERHQKDLKQKSLEIEKSKNEIEAKAKELELASKYKSEFLANMSHELRTPLNSLLILSETLANNDDGNLTEDQIEMATVINNGGNSLLTLINDILDLSKVEAGKLSLDYKDSIVSELVESLKRQIEPMAKTKNLDLNFIIENGVPSTLYTDFVRVEQILRNLLSNAVKFTEKGSINLKVSSETIDSKSFVKFSVIDTGIGIPDAKQKDIFEAFQQVDGSSKRKFGGTGLGLTISRKLASLLKGKVQFESVYEKGSTFSLYVPLEESKSNVYIEESETVATMLNIKPLTQSEDVVVEQKEVVTKVTDETDLKEDMLNFADNISDDRNNISGHEKTLLIIEDNKNFANALKRIANNKGFKCLVANTGQKGIKMAMEYTPTGIILDLGLPDIDGLKVLDSIKSNRSTRKIPVHLISGHDQEISYLEKGAIGYLTKPVSIDALDSLFSKVETFTRKEVKKILVVDDDEDTLLAVTNLISSKGIEIDTANNGTDGLSKVLKGDYDCIVLDLQLPDMTGLDILEKASNDGSCNLPPVVVYTARELTKEEYQDLRKYTSSIIVKGTLSIERLKDETSLFLHSVNKDIKSNVSKIFNNSTDENDESLSLNGKKILLVDDDLRNTFAITKALQKYGLQITIADNGKLALDKLSKDPNVDLVIMDIMMPVMDGYEAIAKIREKEEYINLPIIALTAKAMPEDKAKCFEVGASDYLAKPVKTEELLTLIKLWIFKKNEQLRINENRN